MILQVMRKKMMICSIKQVMCGFNLVHILSYPIPLPSLSSTMTHKLVTSQKSPVSIKQSLNRAKGGENFLVRRRWNA